MAETTAISWTDATFNPWTGCTKVSPGCDGCYAESWSKRAGDKVGKWGPGAPRVRTTPANWRKPLKWDETPFYACSCCGWRGDRPTYDVLGSDVVAASCPHCVDAGRDHVLRIARRRVFCASLADVFDNEVPQEWRADLFDLIDATKNLDWLLLTKRIGNVGRMIPDRCSVALPRNVWLGATVVNQEEADRDIAKLLAVKMLGVRFLSMEPLLRPVDLATLHYTNADDWVVPALPDLDWVIVGGESGHGARPMHPDWVRSLRDQCAAAGVSFHFKQWGEWVPNGQQSCRDALLHGDRAARTVRFHDFQDLAQTRSTWVGTKAAGRLLDGIEHNGFPEVRNA